MSDEALNAHLDWLDKCAEEHMNEQHECKLEVHNYEEHVGAEREIRASCRCGQKILTEDDIDMRLNEYETLRTALDVAMNENQRLTKIVEDYEEADDAH